MAQGKTPEDFRAGEKKKTHKKEQGHFPGRGEFIDDQFGGDIRDEKHGEHEGEDHFEIAFEGGIRQPGDVEQVIITPHNSLRADSPKARGREHEHKRVMDEKAGQGENQEAADLGEGWKELEFVAGISHDCDSARAIDEAAQINLAEGNEKARVDGKQEHKIQFACADVFGKLGQIGQEKRGEKLLDELAGADEENDLPFRPCADMVCMAIDDGDECELEGKPEQFHDDPEEKIRFELHLPDDGVFPKRAINRSVLRNGKVPGLTRHERSFAAERESVE
jgi:hypothetical protein